MMIPVLDSDSGREPDPDTETHHGGYFFTLTFVKVRDSSAWKQAQSPDPALEQYTVHAVTIF
jgi:hypothetical protein